MEISSKLSEQIIQDLTNTNLYGTQIGYKYGLPRCSIDRLGKKCFGKELYYKREKATLKKLLEVIEKKMLEGKTGGAIALEVGIPRTSIYNFIDKIKARQADNYVDVISLDESGMPVSNTAVVSQATEQTQALDKNTAKQLVASSQQVKAPVPLATAKSSYQEQDSYHNSQHRSVHHYSNYRVHPNYPNSRSRYHGGYLPQNTINLNVKGISISFNGGAGVEQTVVAIINAIQHSKE